MGGNLFARFHERLKDREDGFTLIELLVVILIIAILAAIAIPVFLNQRKKGWVAQAESTAKNMATSEESFLTGNSTGSYTLLLSDLATEGFKYSSVDVTPSVPAIDAGLSYCIKVVSGHDASIIRFYASGQGRPTTTDCTASKGA